MTSNPIREHDIVAILADAPDLGLSAGDTGAVVHCYPQGSAYEVEFVEVTGRTKAVVTLEARQLLKLNWRLAAVK